MMLSRFKGTPHSDLEPIRDEVKKIVVEEVLDIIQWQNGFDFLLADDLGVGRDYRLWHQVPTNIGLMMQLKIEFILKSFQSTYGRDANLQKLKEQLSDRSNYRMLLDRLDSLEVGNTMHR